MPEHNQKLRGIIAIMLRCLGRRSLRLLAMLSLELSVCVATLWLLSYGAGLQGSCNTIAARYTVRATSGFLTILGPPRDDADDETSREIAGRMSNEDFIWMPPVARPVEEFGRHREGYMEGRVREGTATWEMFQRFAPKLRNLEGLTAAKRIWMKALDDPRQFVSAHMMLLLFFGRNDVFSREDEWHWGMYEAAALNKPIVFVRTSRNATKPDLSHWLETCDQWHEKVDVRICLVPFAVPLGITLVLPLITMARPHRQPCSKRRWAFNTLSAMSLLLCIAAVAAWHRSNSVADGWRFAPRPATPIYSGEHTWLLTSYKWLESSEGQIEIGKATFFETTLFEGHMVDEQRHRLSSILFGDQNGWFTIDPPDRYWIGPDLPHWAIPGLEFCSFPTAADWDSETNVTNLQRGGGYLRISWWIPMVALAILPASWCRSFMRRKRQEFRQRRNQCPACGYDLRATPIQCPECGAMPERLTA